MKESLGEAWSEMINKLESWIDSIVLNLPNILIAIVVFIIAVILSRYVKKLVLKILSKSTLQPSMRKVLAKIIAIIVIIGGLFLILGILNLSKTLNTILAGAGVAGLAVGLALQGALANTYSGIVLSYIKQIKIGDWIETNGYEGSITDINLRATTIKQADNNMVYIPNKLVVENPIKNFSNTSQSKVMLECGVGYESDLRATKDLVVKTVMKNFDDVENAEDIIFIWQEFGGSSINFQVRFWIDSTSALEVATAKSEAIMLIAEVFDENDINIPFPIRTLDIPDNMLDRLSKSEQSNRD